MISSLATETGRLEILSVLDNLLGHPFHQLAVILLEDALRAIESFCGVSCKRVEMLTPA